MQPQGAIRRATRGAWLGLALFLFWLLGLTGSIAAQSERGELRVKVTDPDGLAVKCIVQLESVADRYHKQFSTDEQGIAIAKLLPFGIYRIDIQQPSFEQFSEPVEIRSAVPSEFHVALRMPTASTIVTVRDIGNTLIDPYRVGSISRVGTEEVEGRAASPPGRSLQDLVNSQQAGSMKGTLCCIRVARNTKHNLWWMEFH